MAKQTFWNGDEGVEERVVSCQFPLPVELKGDPFPLTGFGVEGLSLLLTELLKEARTTNLYLAEILGCTIEPEEL